MHWGLCALGALVAVTSAYAGAESVNRIGQESGVNYRLKDGDEYRMSVAELVDYGRAMFAANWTVQDGAGRPQMKGNGRALSDPSDPLVGPRAFNRVSAPDANSCAGCHNMPFGIPGGSGDFVTNVFVLGQRFDFVNFDAKDKIATKGSMDELGHPVTMNNVANLRASTDMFGAGYIEMLAREMTADLQKIRDSMAPGESRILESKGIIFGKLIRGANGLWDVRGVVGLPRASILTATPVDPPTLIVRPWHQASNVVSLREFVNNALNHHHGMQTTERFGTDTDPDGDGILNETSRAEVTALAVFQAALPVPGQVIPNDPEIEKAIQHGDAIFRKIGCAECHIPALPLTKHNWSYTEPNPYNPGTNLRTGEAPTLKFNLFDPSLPKPRLAPGVDGSATIMVPVYTDFKLHDITDPADDYGAEPLNMNQSVWSPKFVEGNRKFLTKRLWGAANQPPYFHHGLFTTLREAVLGHSGEALASRKAFQAASQYDQDTLIEFLKSLQVLPPGTEHLVVDENYQAKVPRDKAALR